MEQIFVVETTTHKNSELPSARRESARELIKFGICNFATIVLALNKNVGCRIVLAKPEKEPFSSQICIRDVYSFSAIVNPGLWLRVAE